MISHCSLTRQTLRYPSPNTSLSFDKQSTMDPRHITMDPQHRHTHSMIECTFAKQPINLTQTNVIPHYSSAPSRTQSPLVRINSWNIPDDPIRSAWWPRYADPAINLPGHPITAFHPSTTSEAPVDSAIVAISTRSLRVSATVLRMTCATPLVLPKLQHVLKTFPTQLPSSLHSSHVFYLVHT